MRREKEKGSDPCSSSWSDYALQDRQIPERVPGFPRDAGFIGYAWMAKRRAIPLNKPILCCNVNRHDSKETIETKVGTATQKKTARKGSKQEKVPGTVCLLVIRGQKGVLARFALGLMRKMVPGTICRTPSAQSREMQELPGKAGFSASAPVRPFTCKPAYRHTGSLALRKEP